MLSLKKINAVSTAMLFSCMAFTVSATPIASNQTTHYVSDTYAKRQQGYDWVAVSTTPQADGSLKISVRSRADRKKPTCTLDTVAYPQGQSIYTAVEAGQNIRVQIQKNGLTIDSDSAGGLAYFCSGGATLAGKYSKLASAKLDSKQVDNTIFSKTLSLQNVQFYLNAKPQGKGTVLNIATSGLAHDYREQLTIAGKEIVGAEVEDLNSDGAPELLVYLRQQTKPYRAEVLAFSANKKQSLSQVYLPDVREQPEYRTSYRGGDVFRVVETRLVQRFPIYDAKGKATGKTQQIAYRLIDGEASRRFEQIK